MKPNELAAAIDEYANTIDGATGRACVMRTNAMALAAYIREQKEPGTEAGQFPHPVPNPIHPAPPAVINIIADTSKNPQPPAAPASGVKDDRAKD